MADRHAFAARLEGLEAEAYASGYLSADKLQDNLRLTFHEVSTGLDYLLQINRARSAYATVSHPLPPGARCRICRENEGAPGKENLKTLRFSLLEGREFFFQWTPFPLFPQHGVVILKNHEPMSLDLQTLVDGAAFLDLAPEYTFFSNSDLPQTGASILEHLHYQVGRGKVLPAQMARVRAQRRFRGVEMAWLDYPLAAVRLGAPGSAALIPAAQALITQWKQRSPENHSLNLAWRLRESGTSELTLFFRSRECLTPPPLLRYKTEGVGVIEAGGEFIFPVPTGPEAAAIEREIVSEGRRIILGFLHGLDPWKDEGEQIFASFQEDL